MATQLHGIYGVGGHGRETMAWARARGTSAGEYVFIDDSQQHREMNGHRVLTYAEFRIETAAVKRVNVAIADSRTREALVTKCQADGIGFFSVVATSAVIGDSVELGDGCIVSPFALITANVTVGAHVHVNMHTYVAHDCRIASFVTFGPGVCCNGNVTVSRHAYIGAGAMIRQGRPDVPMMIGEGAVIGMGAVVLHPVQAGVTVVGNPARSIDHDTDTSC
jgi:sugar O-acyltransferase (sialic acid O-acetyltransferase NeuD family)